MDGLHRIVVAGKNRDLSYTAMQDTVRAPDPGMELYTAYIHSRQAGESLLKAHVLRERDKIAADHHHTRAMEQLDLLADALGLDLVPRADVVTR